VPWDALGGAVNKRRWYSGSCRRVCIVDGRGAITSEMSVFVFRATDRAAAIRRLRRLGRKEEQEYVNGYGERVRWALVSLETVDELGEGRMRELEVHSTWTEIEPPDASLTLATHFAPEAGEPGHSGVMGW
jgi:hypothetical protein